MTFSLVPRAVFVLKPSDHPSVRQEAKMFGVADKMPNDLTQYLFAIMLPSLYCTVKKEFY